MTISFNTVPSNTLVPLFYAEMNNSAANTAVTSAPALLIGHASNDAAIEVNSLVLMPSADYARQICGAGSQLARMVEVYRQTDPFGELYVIAVPEARGAAATVRVTVAGEAEESGTLSLYVGRSRVQVPVVNGDDATAVATAIKEAVNGVITPEESPENKTGIVRCDLIDCANNFKEITTMPARSLCQNFLNNILAPLHLYRQKSLIDATNAVINGASLTLTSIGRHLTGTASVKNKIKRVDRLLGNRHLQNEVSTIFQRITQKITRGMSRVVILIDWSAYHASRFQLLRASLACDGRSLPLMSCVVPSSQTANADVHERFLESLAECFSPGTDVIVITDAGFQGRWFQQLRSRGWTYICRVLGNHYYNVGNGWEKVSDSGTKASTTAIYLGEGLLGRDKNAQHEGHFYLYKSKPKGRRFKRSKERATRPSVTAKARTAGKSPWFIFTNSTEFSPKQVMKLYSRRMQIEQNFRDEKNPRWGFGLRFGASHSSGRVTVLSLIATLASIIMWLSGFSLENKGIHHKYQANTVKHRRVISLLKLAENVIRHSPLILNTLSLDAGLKVLQQRYTNMIMVY
ncbi:transposase [Escherichia coli]|nr:transposase [Escherichia coli]